MRNPRFRSWSPEARPDGFPDAITVTPSKDAAAQVAAVQHGRADAIVAAGMSTVQLPVDQARALALADASHVYTGPTLFTHYLFLNVRERPFDDPRVRRALNYAIDRRRMVELAGGSGLAGLSCQVIPPGLPGYAPTCSFTAGATEGAWGAPDLARARRLIAASGSRGARVQVWGWPPYRRVIRYAGSVLRHLGYRVRIRVVPDVADYFNYVNDTRHHVQVGFYGWFADFLTPSNFFDPFTCGHVVRNSSDNVNPSEFCDRAVEAGNHAALAARGSDANARWALLDRRVLAAAPVVPLFTRRSLMLLSDRVGNAQMHQALGPLLDQFWVR